MKKREGNPQMPEMKNLKSEWEMGTDPDSEIASGASPWSFSARPGIEMFSGF